MRLKGNFDMVLMLWNLNFFPVEVVITVNGIRVNFFHILYNTTLMVINKKV